MVYIFAEVVSCFCDTVSIYTLYPLLKTSLPK